MLQRYAFEEKGIAFEMDVDCRQFPNRWADLLLFEGKGTAFLQPAQQPPSEGHVMDKVALDFADAVLLVIDDQVAGHAAEDASLARGWMEGWRRFEVQ